MLRNFLLVAWRNLRRNPTYTGINLLGLSLGLASCLLLLLYVRHEQSYDRHLPHVDHMYRVDRVQYLYDDMNGRINNAKIDPILGYERHQSYTTPAPLMRTVLTEVPGVLAATRYYDSRTPVRVANQIQAENIQFVDSGFCRVFAYEVLAGDYPHALDRIDQVVITRAVAERFFGSVAQALGGQMDIRIKGEMKPFTVAGVLENPPANISVPYNILARVEHMEYFHFIRDGWNMNNTSLWVLTAAGVQPQDVNARLAEVVRKYHFPEMTDSLTRARIAQGKPVLEYTLTPVTDVHLNVPGEWETSGDYTSIQVLGGLALLILFVACINYVILALSRALARSREVSVRVAIGAGRRQLIGQFLTEAGVLVTLSLAIAIVIVQLALPEFATLAQRKLTLSLADPGFWVLALSCMLVIVIAGGFPAWWMSHVRPTEALKGRATYRVNPWGIRGLVLLQFAVSIFLVGGTLVLFRQMDFITNQRLGYDTEQVVVLNLPNGLAPDQTLQLANRFRTQVANSPEVEAVGLTNIAFARGWSVFTTNWRGKDIEHVNYCVDDGYLAALGIPLLAGRNFSQVPGADRTAVILNEKAVAQLGIATPAEAIGQPVDWLGNGTVCTIIGVVPDYHYQSLRDEIKPMLLYHDPAFDNYRQLLVRLRPQQLQAGIARVEQAYKASFPDLPFAIRFLREDVNRQYDDVQRWRQMLSIGAGMALMIAVLGVVGLAGITAMNRQKEIGIRKVLGASEGQVLYQLNRELLLVMLLGGLVAVPATWYAASQWLETFHYRIGLSASVFAIAIGLVGLLAVAAVTLQTWNAVRRNPVQSLRSE